MNPFTNLLLIVLVMASCKSSGQKANLSWPEGAHAAVCLTYDDGIDSQLDIAIPDLDKYGLKGTFFIQGDNLTPKRIDQWKMAAANGHELANHTVFHPCSDSHDWVWEEFANENYSVRRLLRELGVMNNFLYALDGQKARTYAYTCSEVEFGGISVVDSLRYSGLFLAARSGSAEPTSPANVDLFEIPSFTANVGNAQELIPTLEKARETRGLVVLTFHGVGGDYLEVTRDQHLELIKYLSQNTSDYWVVPFHEAAKHLISEKQRLGLN